MEEIYKAFREKGYAKLEGFLDSENCKEYTEEFFKAKEQGLTITDDSQVQNSHCLPHSVLFDSLLEQLLPNVEKVTQKKLFPTYSYARIYTPGDELKIHRDRPSCEISLTLTLGFEGEPWGIFMGYDEDKKYCQEIKMNVGDAVIYKGCDLYHWREKYKEGKWQAQVFLHYVDEEGVHKEWRYDKRDKLSHHDQIKNTWDGIYKSIEGAFSSKQCDALVQGFEEKHKDKYVPGYVGDGTNQRIDKEIRDVNRILANTDIGIGATLTGIGLNANQSSWKFNVTHSNQVEYLKYDKEGHFNAHMDTFLEQVDSQSTRKLSVLLICNDDFEGGKFYFYTSKDKIYPPQKKGDVIIFPSFIKHGVEPVTSGIRRSIITWVVGPYFK